MKPRGKRGDGNFSPHLATTLQAGSDSLMIAQRKTGSNAF
ncbi:hypothetical protein ALO_08445 [Acetonema longum DSM 6540]|uniref:Uncharacterized protein n=1 Tax=Acetonema longum DSM 6540 TaxID=1009370 RepID=F7NHZ1_9FIRM|nr:hypothetical protein ALO_08445 [Acetonema longum DSM 6540]